MKEQDVFNQGQARLGNRRQDRHESKITQTFLAGAAGGGGLSLSAALAKLGLALGLAKRHAPSLTLPPGSEPDTQTRVQWGQTPNRLIATGIILGM